MPSSLVLRRVVLTLVLIGFAFYAFFLAPHARPDPGFGELAVGRGAGRNAALFAVFNLLGVVPLMYWAVLIPDGLGQRVWVWPFALGMMALGCFALLPYLILRRPYRRAVPGTRRPWVRWFEGRSFAVFLTLALVLLLGDGLARGDWAGYADWFRTSNLINVMSVDFVLMTALFPLVLRDDIARRGLRPDSPLSRLALGVPLLGPAAYLLLRPGEVEEEPGSATAGRA